MIASIELLLSYANRFYNRQFLTRQPVNTALLTKLEQLLTDYINGEAIQEKGVPTVRGMADQLDLSPAYLSDSLKKKRVKVPGSTSTTR